MKSLLLLIAFAFAGSCLVPAQELRTFTSADGSKTFEGTLLAYSEEAGKIRVRLKSGKESTLPLSALSEADGKWIKESGAWVLRAAALEIELKPDKQKEEVIEDEAGDRSHRTIRIHDEGYKVVIRNPTKELVEDLEADYVFYSRRQLTDEYEIVACKGSLSFGRLEPGEESEEFTDYLPLEGAERVLGMVLHIKHGDTVLRTVESKPGVGAELEAKMAKQKPK